MENPMERNMENEMDTGIIQRLYNYIGVIKGLCRANGKEHGSYCNGVMWG